MTSAKEKPKHIVAQSIRREVSKTTNRELWATICYYYPQYTLQEASQLSIRDIKLLLKTAEKLEAQKMLAFTQIAAAPHTKKGQGVKKLTDYYKNQLG